jgi:predicted SnoaL-like aldol condensation-catalyzing enzyme
VKLTIAGIILTAYLIYDMHHGQDWSGGQGHTPRTFIMDYLDMAYAQGHGVEAAQKYFAPAAVDHSPYSADRMDGPPITHNVRQIIEDGLTVAVYHHIDAARGEPELEVVDIYKTKRGHILERTRIRQPGVSAGTNSPET